MAKKTFKGTAPEIKANPALSFITESVTDPMFTGEQRETKSKRLNLLVKPSLYRNMEKIATMERISTNELINRVLESYVNSHSDTIERYNDTFKGDK